LFVSGPTEPLLIGFFARVIQKGVALLEFAHLESLTVLESALAEVFFFFFLSANDAPKGFSPVSQHCRIAVYILVHTRDTKSELLLRVAIDAQLEEREVHVSAAHFDWLSCQERSPGAGKTYHPSNVGNSFAGYRGKPPDKPVVFSPPQNSSIASSSKRGLFRSERSNGSSMREAGRSPKTCFVVGIVPHVEQLQGPRGLGGNHLASHSAACRPISFFSLKKLSKTFFFFFS